MKHTLKRRKSSLEEELQDIHNERVRRKSSFSNVTQIVFLEMDLHGLFATRSFSHRKMLSYLHDNISTFDNMEPQQKKENKDEAFTFEPR